MKRLIIFLIRRRLGLRKHQTFKFANQKNKDAMYYFTSTGVVKIYGTKTKRSNVSLNWLLDDECKIIKGGI